MTFTTAFASHQRMSQTNEFARWLEQSYLTWQHKHGKRATLAQFAAYLGISAALLSHYMNGLRRPSIDTAHRFAKRLGPEIYDLLGLQRPDAKLQFISRNWDKLTNEQQLRLIAEVEKYIDEEKPKGKSKG